MLDTTLTTDGANELLLFQSILEVDKNGIIQKCLGKNCNCEGKSIEHLSDVKDSSVFIEFFDRIMVTEEVGFESYFTSESDNYTKLTFMGMRDDHYVLIQSEIDKNRTGIFLNDCSEIIQIIDIEGNLIHKNAKWMAQLGYKSEKVNIKEILHPDYKDSYQSYFTKQSKTESTEPKVLGLKTESGKSVFVECKSQLKNVNGKAALVCVMRDLANDVSTLQDVNDQSARIKAIFQTGNILFWSVNKNKALTSFNEAYSKTIQKQYGVTPEVNSDLSLPKKKFASEDYHSFWDKKYEEVFENGEGTNFLTRTNDDNGNTYFREIYLNPIISYREVKEVVGLALDVTDQKLASKKIQEQSKKINTIFNAANHMIWSVNESLELTYFNELYKQQVDKRFDINIDLGNIVYELAEFMDESILELWRNRYHRAFQGEQVRFELEFKDYTGIENTAEVSLNPIFNEEGQIIEVAGISQTVTYKKAAEKKLKAQAAKIQAIFDSTAMLIWTVD
ncbi:MAG: PAS domain S-box-containing protein, partial [Flavobacteriales bacterium]